MNKRFSSIAVIFILLGGFASAQQLPDAAHVADRIGEYVKFEDSIKAVSKSRTHDGFYFSFGAPYPKQVLTVWVPSRVFKHLPNGLLNRTVRISGMLQKTDTGPMLGLEARDQFEILPTDESILSKPRIDGKTESKDFRIAVRQHFEREDFDTIETLGRELHQSKERSADGSWLVESFFHAFKLAPDTANKRYERWAQIIADWKKRYPTSILPILTDASYHVDLAWKWRGTEWADKVTKEGWENFKRELSVARQILESHPAAKSFPVYFVNMQTIALGERWSRDEYLRLFGEAISHEPDYYPFYYAAAYRLLPKWAGKKGDWEKFAEQQRAQRGGAEGDILYTRIAWSLENEYRHHLFDRSAASWEIMVAGFTALMQQHPDSRFLKNVYAHFAWEARDRARLAAALEAITSDPDMEVWVNLENVEFAKKFADNERRPATR
jgi:hypothetical protein